LGLFSTFLATRLWNFASRVLPTGLVGQLIVSETVFALLYSFIYDVRWPHANEWIAMVAMVGGVLLAVQSYQVKTLNQANVS
jgi:drug/metabolite transporter (DMT)-like permease